MAERRRLDVEVAERGLAPSRARAQALILAGKVTVNGQVVTKAGTQVKAGAQLEVAEPDHPYASRGALKLEAALDDQINRVGPSRNLRRHPIPQLRQPPEYVPLKTRLT